MNKNEQSDLFKEAARDAGADESDDALDRIIGKLDLTKKSEKNALANVDGKTKHQRDSKPAKRD